MDKKILRLVLIPLTLSALVSCGQTQEEENLIYASFYPIYDFASRIAGDCMEVINLTPPGSEPHDYEPTVSGVKGMLSAKAVLINGLGLENWTDSVPDELQAKLRTVTGSIETKELEGSTDPHVWLDVDNAILEMEAIKDILIELDPDNQSVYTANFETEKARFEALDQELTELASTIENKCLVVSHAAFGYLASAYGFTQIYVSGLSPEEEPSPKALEEVIAKVNEYGVSTIYYEENVSSSIAEKIASETGAKTATLNPLETLEEEDLGVEDYLSVMRQNMETIKEGQA